MAQFPKIESIGSIRSISFGIWELQVVTLLHSATGSGMGARLDRAQHGELWATWHLLELQASTQELKCRSFLGIVPKKKIGHNRKGTTLEPLGRSRL